MSFTPFPDRKNQRKILKCNRTQFCLQGKRSIGCVTRDIVNTTKRLYEFELLGKEKYICKYIYFLAIFAFLCIPLYVLTVSLLCLHDYYMSELQGMLLFSCFLSFIRHKRIPCACPWVKSKLDKNKIHVQEKVLIRWQRWIIDLRFICFNRSS